MQLAQPTLLEEDVEAFAGAADAARGGAIGVVAKGLLALELEDVADLGEQARNLGVGVGRGSFLGHDC